MDEITGTKIRGKVRTPLKIPEHRLILEITWTNGEEYTGVVHRLMDGVRVRRAPKPIDKSRESGID